MKRNGASGADLVLPVPPGTVVKDASGHVVVDLVAAGQEHAIARGGRGGLGNKALASPRRGRPASRCSASRGTPSTSSSS